MRLLAVADIHGKTNRLAIIEKKASEHRIDCLIVAGDISAYRNSSTTIERLAALAVPVLIVRGNADAADLGRQVSAFDQIIDLHLNRTVVAGIPFFGLAGAVPIPFYAKMAWREQPLIERAARVLQTDSVLVTHTPPRGSADKVLRCFRAGSQALGKLVDDKQPRLVICGHIHEACGIVYRGASCVVNCSMGNGGKGMLIDMEPGKTVADIRKLE